MFANNVYKKVKIYSTYENIYFSYRRYNRKFNNQVIFKVFSSISPVRNSAEKCGEILKHNLKRSYCISGKSKTEDTAMSGRGDEPLMATYEDILEAQQDQNTIMIDVREDSEIIQTGKLPGSIHIPMGDVPKFLETLSPIEFERICKKKKPTHNTKIIVSCRSGKRSTMVQNALLKLGYHRTYNYAGGWLDWESHQK